MATTARKRAGFQAEGAPAPDAVPPTSPAPPARVPAQKKGKGEVYALGVVCVFAAVVVVVMSPCELSFSLARLHVKADLEQAVGLLSDPVRLYRHGWPQYATPRLGAISFSCVGAAAAAHLPDWMDTDAGYCHCNVPPLSRFSDLVSDVEMRSSGVTDGSGTTVNSFSYVPVRHTQNLWSQPGNGRPLDASLALNKADILEQGRGVITVQESIRQPSRKANTRPLPPRSVLRAQFAHDIGGRFPPYRCLQCARCAVTGCARASYRAGWHARLRLGGACRGLAVYMVLVRPAQARDHPVALSMAGTGSPQPGVEERAMSKCSN